MAGPTAAASTESVLIPKDRLNDEKNDIATTLVITQYGDSALICRIRYKCNSARMCKSRVRPSSEKARGETRNIAGIGDA
jgi:hypothetical protein